MKKYPQQKEYTCGPASVRTLLERLNVKPDTESKTSVELNTSKISGTSLYDIIVYFAENNIVLYNIPKRSKMNFGICLVNADVFYNEKSEDDNNGHWVYFERIGNTFKIFDPYYVDNINLSANELLTTTKDIKYKDIIYNDIILYA